MQLVAKMGAKITRLVDFPPALWHTMYVIFAVRGPRWLTGYGINGHDSVKSAEK